MPADADVLRSSPRVETHTGGGGLPMVLLDTRGVEEGIGGGGGRREEKGGEGRARGSACPFSLPLSLSPVPPVPFLEGGK